MGDIMGSARQPSEMQQGQNVAGSSQASQPTSESDFARIEAACRADRYGSMFGNSGRIKRSNTFFDMLNRRFYEANQGS